MGQLRFSLRKDIDPASFGNVRCEELRGCQPSQDDLILIAKKYMASPEPYKVAVLLSAEQCATLRKSFCQPSGVAARRAISQQVQTNIRGKVGPLVRGQMLHRDAAAYLSNWSTGTLRRIPRPTSYSVLEHRYEQGPENSGERVPWEPKRNQRHIDLTVPQDGGDGEQLQNSDSDGDDAGPIVDAE